MIDFYRKSVLSQLGKDAGNQNMTEFTRNVVGNYDKYLTKMNEQKAKPVANKGEDFGLYL